MDERWYYRYFDREVGPLDFRSLQALAEAGQIGQEDVVRTDTARAWVKARTIPNLFTQAASVDDLDAMLESAAGEAPSTPSSGAKREEGCYCLVMGRELGPMSFEELGELARKGELTPRHKVRIRANADWIDAGSIVGLFEEERQRDTSDLSSLMASAPAADAGDFELQRSTSLLAPQRRSDSDVETIEREWFWKLMGNETGPFTFEAIHELAQNGRLSRTDQIRSGRSGEWVSADSIVGLFPDEADDYDDEDEEEEDDEFRFEDFVEDGESQQRKRKSRAAGRRKAGRRDGRHGTPRRLTRNEPETKTRTAVPSVERTPAASPAAEQARPEPAPVPTPAYVPPPPPRPAPVKPVPMKTKRSFDAGGLNINWKYAGIGAAVVLVGLGLWHVGLPSFGGGGGFGGGVVGETLTIWQEAVLLHQPEYEGARWDEFKERTLPRVKEIAAELEKEGGTDPESQTLLKCHKEYLPKILEAGPTKRTQEWNDMVNCVQSLSS